MKKLSIVVLISLITVISCKDKKNSPDRKKSNNEYRIKLTPFQIEQIGKTRTIKLNSGQFHFIKKNRTIIHVNGPRYKRPGRKYQINWIGPDEIMIKSNAVEKIDELIEQSRGSGISLSNSVVINFDINGKMYYRNKLMSLQKVYRELQQPGVKNIFVSLSPIRNVTLKNKMLDMVKRIRVFAKRKKLNFQDDF